ncbi:hypothetical protein, partial [Escherichia coli]|uniref:hypothetical protein n=1 Tax=Escherichia coli TaxID=562 RepID=UPI003F214786
LREQLAALDGEVDAAVQTHARLEMRTLVERATRWLVTHRRPPLDSEATVDFFGVDVQRAMGELPALMGGREGRAYDARRAALV